MFPHVRLFLRQTSRLFSSQNIKDPLAAVRLPAGFLHAAENLRTEYADLLVRVQDTPILAKRISQVHPLLTKVDAFTALVSSAEDTREMARSEQDRELAKMAEAEFEELVAKAAAAREQLMLDLLPKDESDDKDAIIEIRAGAGGDEASLFAQELVRMYCRFAERQSQWKYEILSLSPTEVGGVREATINVSGPAGVYALLKHESGVHRIQRVPATEAGGRVHTSTASVAVLPDAEHVADIDINEADLRIDTYRAGGAGGQHVNKTESAVRITHIPTGTVVAVQDERSQHKNKARAMKILRARLFESMRIQRQQEQNKQRSSLVGTMDRSEKVRTYNVPQDRITDHRIGLSKYGFQEMMDGSLLLEFVYGLDRQSREEQLQHFMASQTK